MPKSSASCREGWAMCWRRARRAKLTSGRRAALARMAVALAAFAAVVATPAGAVTLVPPKPNVFFGVSDRGTTQEFDEFAELLGGKHPALLETFHPWGNSLNKAYERWRETG